MYYLIQNQGGYAKIAKLLTDILGEKITDEKMHLWRSRGGVSLNYAKRIGDALKVSPYLVSYKRYSKFTGEKPEWKTLIEKCPKLAPAQKKDILAKKAPEV